MLAEVIMRWYAINSAVRVGAWSIHIARYMFHASIHEEKEAIFLEPGLGGVDRSLPVEASCTVSDL